MFLRAPLETALDPPRVSRRDDGEMSLLVQADCRPDRPIGECTIHGSITLNGVSLSVQRQRSCLLESGKKSRRWLNNRPSRHCEPSVRKACETWQRRATGIDDSRPLIVAALEKR